ncbi:CD2-associated protein isoform X1 [Hemibagrus wyckioides]|uniref:CD2-associated protein isoform X1 n=2 Tax=Hemibagrus wyckioides TaxID=337641 RepID=UPI00266C23B0|nr:CD2-associated protein isoform X1 [Hemibagrus wyckioides]
MVEVVVEFDYEAAHEDELTLRLGDVIKNVRRIEEDGWMEGDLNGRRGLFPDNFVKELRKESKEETKEVKEVKEVKEMKEDAQRRSSGNVASLVQRISTYGIPAGGLGFQPRTSKKKPKKRQCKVLFEYVPQNEDELELKVGDIIEISEEVEEGWWSGIMNGKSGLFPSNFVKEIETNEDGESNDVPEEPEGKDEVSSPISPGNGVIAHPKKIKGVGFGNIFREGSVKLKPRLSDSEEKKERPVPSLPSAPKPSPINTADAHKMEKDGDSKGKLKEYCKATYNYEATNQDELDLKEGDIVHLLSKDTGEPGWWRGELNGRAGVFPDNFVVLIPDSEKETLLSKGSIKQTKPEPEEKPRKPPPPSKSAALKPEVPSTDKKPAQLRPEDKVDRALVDKPAKPAPIVPPKKPVPPPGKGLLRPVALQPKRPEKPLAPSPVAKHNGEVPHTRPKSDFEPSLPSKPKTLSGDWAEKTTNLDLMSFDDVSATSEKLSHPTANRPKMPGRRLPAQFSGNQSPNKEVNEKAPKTEEEETPRPKPSEKLSHVTPSSVHKAASFSTPEPKAKTEVDEGKGKEMDELRTQIKELLLSVELLKTQQTRELADLRSELDEERLKRVALQMEIEKLKKQVQST